VEQLAVPSGSGLVLLRPADANEAVEVKAIMKPRAACGLSAHASNVPTLDRSNMLPRRAGQRRLHPADASDGPQVILMGAAEISLCVDA
jgi:transketolase